MLDDKKYQIWYDDNNIVLVPIVPTLNLHTLRYKYCSKEELEEIKKMFKGTILKVNFN